MPQLQSNHQYSPYNCSNHPSRVILLGLLMSAIGSTQAATPIKPNKPPSSKLITDVTTYVERDWRSDDGQFFLTLYSGVWNPHGTLFFLKKRGGLSVEGFQKGLNITLASFDPEIGLEASPEYAVTGALNLRSNTLIGSVTHYSKGTATVRKTTFTPAIPIKEKTYPQYTFKYYGFEDPDWHRATITRVEVINKDTKAIVQTLAGFKAQSYSVTYADMNYDGYFDIVLDVGDDVMDEKYIYWLYDSQSKKFVRNKTLEAISGYPNRYPHKKQLYLNKDALLERVNGQWKKMPCCYAD